MLTLILAMLLVPALAQEDDAPTAAEEMAQDLDETHATLEELDRKLGEAIRQMDAGEFPEPYEAVEDTGMARADLDDVLDEQCSVEPEDEPTHDAEDVRE